MQASKALTSQPTCLLPMVPALVMRLQDHPDPLLLLMRLQQQARTC